MSKRLRRVLIVVENLPVPFDRRVWMEATTLLGSGWDVTVLCPKTKTWSKSRETIDGVRIMRHPMPAEGSSLGGFMVEYLVALFHEFRLARTAWRDGGFDVIHICNPPDLLFLVATWYKLRHKVKVVFDQHDLGPELFVAKYNRKGFLHKALLLCERLTYRLADKVIATNESYREVALTRGKKDTDDVAVVRSAPDVERFKPMPTVPRYRGGATHVVGYVGVMGAQEGLDLLLESMKYIVVELGRTDVRLMAIGGGPALESLKLLVDEFGIGDNVEFTGRVPDDELVARLSSTDVCVAPDPVNGFNELCTMNKVLEYMALGRPVVQFDVVEGRRSAEGASLYAANNDPVAFAEAILQILDDPAAQQEMGTIGIDRMHNELGWKYQREPLLALYESLDISS